MAMTVQERVTAILARKEGVDKARVQLDYCDPFARRIYYSISQQKELYWEIKEPYSIRGLDKITDEDMQELYELLLKNVGNWNRKGIKPIEEG